MNGFGAILGGWGCGGDIEGHIKYILVGQGGRSDNAAQCRHVILPKKRANGDVAYTYYLG